ncbi:hypothetical protein [Streptomyces sp. NPDC058401]|uniref:hypothetical protein n=1 Tax=Streptomyces sp. NPDC058401 TaxID=3346480 RepID=UPI0036636AC3
MRASTLNVAGIVGFDAAAELITGDTVPAVTQIRALRDRLQDRLLDAIPGTTVNGHLSRRLPGTSDPSHVLIAIVLTRHQARQTLRLGIGRTTTAAEIERAAALISQAAAMHRRLAPAPPERIRGRRQVRRPPPGQCRPPPRARR